MVAKIPRQLDNSDTGIPSSDLDGDVQGVVRRTVVDHHDLVVITHIRRLGRGPSMELLDVGTGLVQGRDDGELHHESSRVATTSTDAPTGNEAPAAMSTRSSASTRST